MIKTLLFPSSYFSKDNVDEDMKKEYNAALNTKLFDIVLFDYDKFVSSGELQIYNPNGDDVIRQCIYRGYMLNDIQYNNFYEKLKRKKIELITTPHQYNLFHLFPNIYQKIQDDTPNIILFKKDEKIEIEKVKKKFSKFMVKDFVKSVKGTSFPTFFDESVNQDEFDTAMQDFYKYRGQLFTGGICIKEYVNLKTYAKKKNEYRVFYAKNNILSIERNSGQTEYTDKVPYKLIEKYKNLDSPYYTIDFAQKEDGTFIIIEAGDGQVSGLSDFQDYEQYYRGLFYAFNTNAMDKI